MQGNESIIISKCANGYVVNEFKFINVAVPCNSQLAYQSMQELVQFIRQHFDYRNHNIDVDLDASRE